MNFNTSAVYTIMSMIAFPGTIFNIAVAVEIVTIARNMPEAARSNTPRHGNGILLLHSFQWYNTQLASSNVSTESHNKNRRNTDEYDQPIISSFVKVFHDQLDDFFSGLYGASFKGQDYLHRALLTGIQRVVKERIFS
ncbi:MAG: AAA family ATPase [Synergistaceae bacterium]|nr:AAA family ATPase [Synergistaceae bacterium]